MMVVGLEHSPVSASMEVDWLQKLLAGLARRRQRDTGSISRATLIEIDREALGVEAYELCPEDRELVADVAGRIHAEELTPAPRHELEAHFKEIENHLNRISSRLLDAEHTTRRAERLHGEIDRQLRTAREVLAAAEARVEELERMRRRG